MRRVLLAMSLAVVACRPPQPQPHHQVPYNITVSTGPSFTVIRASFTDRGAEAWSSPDCVGMRVENGEEPLSQQAGRVDVWIPSGAVIGHVELSSSGVYQAQVGGALMPGTQIAASVAGTASVPQHRFSAAPTIPMPIRRMGPDRGFSVRAGAPLRVTWAGGDSTYVALLLLAAHGAPQHAAQVWMVSCVVPRGPLGYTIPAVALGSTRLPPGADTITVAVTADNRVVEGDYALDVTPIGTADDIVTGSVVW